VAGTRTDAVHFVSALYTHPARVCPLPPALACLFVEALPLSLLAGLRGACVRAGAGGLQKERPLLSDYMMQGVPNLPPKDQKRALRMYNRKKIKEFNSSSAKA
jgi:hypothetical protein